MLVFIARKMSGFFLVLVKVLVQSALRISRFHIHKFNQPWIKYIVLSYIIADMYYVVRQLGWLLVASVLNMQAFFLVIIL